jgi:hypothetical protein
MSVSSSAISDARKVTSSLRNARIQIETNVWQMNDAREAIEDDGALIKDALDDHKDVLSSVLKRTGLNLGKLKISELREKYGVFVAFWIFVACITFIILRRLRFFVLLYFIGGILGIIKSDKKSVTPSVSPERHETIDSQPFNIIGDREIEVALSFNANIDRELIEQATDEVFSTYNIPNADFLPDEEAMEHHVENSNEIDVVEMKKPEIPDPLRPDNKMHSIHRVDL